MYAFLFYTCSVLRNSMSLNWLPITLKLLPLSADVIKTHLSQLLATPTQYQMDQSQPICTVTLQNSQTRLLHAWIIVTKTMRMLTGVSDLVCQFPVHGMLN